MTIRVDCISTGRCEWLQLAKALNGLNPKRDVRNRRSLRHGFKKKLSISALDHGGYEISFDTAAYALIHRANGEAKAVSFGIPCGET